MAYFQLYIVHTIIYILHTHTEGDVNADDDDDDGLEHHNEDVTK